MQSGVGTLGDEVCTRTGYDWKLRQALEHIQDRLAQRVQKSLAAIRRVGVASLIKEFSVEISLEAEPCKTFLEAESLGW